MRDHGEGICSHCGKKFVKNAASQKYCCRLCRSRGGHAEEDARLEAGMAMSSRKCVQCGKEFLGRGDDAFCSPACRREFRMEAAAGDASGRVCHDCGRPTPDYRCSRCRAVWKQIHGVSSFTGDLDALFA